MEEGLAVEGAESRSGSGLVGPFVLDAQTQNGDEPVGEYSFSGQSCLSSVDSC